MLYPFISGFGTGIILSSMLGTVFFCLIQNSIDHGVKSSLFISAGVIFSDILLIGISYFNAEIIPTGGTTEMIVRIAGAGLLIGMGISNFNKKNKVAFPESKKMPIALLFGKGFMLNFFNPGNFISWLAISTMLVNVMHYSIGQRIQYYAGSLLAIFLAEVLIAKGATYLKRFISQRFLYWLNIVLGVVFVIFGVVLLWPFIAKLFHA